MKRKKKINCKKKQLKVQTEELNSHYQMAHIIIWHVAAAAEREGVHTVSWRQKNDSRKKRQKTTSDLKQMKTE